MRGEEHLILIPGMMCDARLWSAQWEPLQTHCRSLSVADVSSYDSIAAMASHILQQAPERFAVAGLSMGGFVVFELWRQAPERITRLALLDTNDHADIADRSTQRDQLLQRAIAGELQQVVADALKPLYLAEANKHDQAILDAVMQMAMDLGVEVFERQCAAIKSRVESRSTLAGITAPTLVLCGVEDKLCPINIHKEMASMIANSKLVLIEECGHLSTMERPDAVNEAMRRWLQAA